MHLMNECHSVTNECQGMMVVHGIWIDTRMIFGYIVGKDDKSSYMVFHIFSHYGIPDILVGLLQNKYQEFNKTRILKLDNP